MLFKIHTLKMTLHFHLFHIAVWLRIKYYICQILVSVKENFFIQCNFVRKKETQYHHHSVISLCFEGMAWHVLCLHWVVMVKVLERTVTKTTIFVSILLHPSPSWCLYSSFILYNTEDYDDVCMAYFCLQGTIDYDRDFNLNN